ncbi:ATPase [Pseudooceanicola nitratireducens]|uniref:ATP12 family chaperone protein n=1 Tax=Pseudooceanicola nitratireducens TaxID=517719 RepID=UPI001C94A8AE|nr:ATP12 family protein [Pseudooceanicola nitratireducens]MBY6165055.1 ATPase [Pseudooceanicola nitratireducens]
MSDWAPKRFWKEVAVTAGEAGHSVALDGRRVRTPAKRPLVLPTEAMARMVAAEWDAQVDKVDPSTMPVTRGANAAIDKVALQHAEVVEMLAAYGDSDLLCYRAEAPQELVSRQAEGWDPLLDWAAAEFGGRLQAQTGVMHQPQDAAVLAPMTQAVHQMSPFQLAAFHDLVSLSGSLVLGFAAARNARDIDTLWALSRIDEDWQAEQWGVDEEAAEAAGIKRQSFLDAKRFFDAS